MWKSVAGIAKGEVPHCPAMPIFPWMAQAQYRHLVNQLGKLICLKKELAKVGELIIQPCRELCQQVGGEYGRDEWRDDDAASSQGDAAQCLRS